MDGPPDWLFEVEGFQWDEANAERDFWSSHDSADYLEWAQARRVRLRGLRLTTRTISIRLPEAMLDRLRVLANKRDVPYQTLLKMFVAERLEAEVRSAKD